MDSISKQVQEGFHDLNAKVDALSIAITAQNTLSDQRYVAKETFESEMTELKNRYKISWIIPTLMTALLSVVIYFLTRG